MLLLELGANDVRDIYRSASDVPTATLESKRQAFDKICENFSPGECPSIILPPHTVTWIISYSSIMVVHIDCLQSFSILLLGIF